MTEKATETMTLHVSEGEDGTYVSVRLPDASFTDDDVWYTVTALADRGDKVAARALELVGAAREAWFSLSCGRGTTRCYLDG